MTDFIQGSGESNWTQDDDSHQWEAEDDYLPPINSAHACDETIVTKVQVFSPTIVSALSDEDEIEEIGENLNSHKTKKMSNSTYLSVNAINELENKSKSTNNVNNISYDEKSSGSRIASMNKLKMKAK